MISLNLFSIKNGTSAGIRNSASPNLMHAPVPRKTAAIINLERFRSDSRKSSESKMNVDATVRGSTDAAKHVCSLLVARKSSASRPTARLENSLEAILYTSKRFISENAITTSLPANISSVVSLVPRLCNNDWDWIYKPYGEKRVTKFPGSPVPCKQLCKGHFKYFNIISAKETVVKICI